MTPRIAWFGFLRVTGKVIRLACVVAAIVGVGWGLWQGIQRAFYNNPDFRLQVIDLNPNSVIDEVGLAETTNLDLTASLFDIDVDAIAEKLRSLPEISSARVERHLPGKLVVRIEARIPCAWVATSDTSVTDARRFGALLVDKDGIAYPCPDKQYETAIDLPVILLPPTDPLVAGQRVTQPELAHCFRLLESARAADPESVQWIESITQSNEWSLLLVTREGAIATFGLGDHSRQIANFRAAIDHSSRKGYAIETINLIPKHNIPITLRGDSPEIPVAVPVAEPVVPNRRDDRRARDLETLLQRN